MVNTGLEILNWFIQPVDELIGFIYKPTIDFRKQSVLSTFQFFVVIFILNFAIESLFEITFNFDFFAEIANKYAFDKEYLKSFGIPLWFFLGVFFIPLLEELIFRYPIGGNISGLASLVVIPSIIVWTILVKYYLDLQFGVLYLDVLFLTGVILFPFFCYKMIARLIKLSISDIDVTNFINNNGRLIVILISVLFAGLHITNFNDVEYSLKNILVLLYFNLPILTSSICFFFFRMRFGFFYGCLFHFFHNFVATMLIL